MNRRLERQMLRRPRKLPPKPDDGLVGVNRRDKLTGEQRLVLLKPEVAHRNAKARMAGIDAENMTALTAVQPDRCTERGCGQFANPGQTLCGTHLSLKLYPPPKR